MRIKEIRKKAGLTQIKLAQKMNVGRSTVGMWETGNSLPTADKLPELAKVLGCSIDELYGNTEEK